MEIHLFHFIAGLAISRERRTGVWSPEEIPAWIIAFCLTTETTKIYDQGRKIASRVPRDPGHESYLSLLTFLSPSGSWDRSRVPAAAFFSLLYTPDPCEWDINSLLSEREIGSLDVVTPPNTMWANGQKQLVLAEYGTNVLSFFCLIILFSFTDAIW